jgi:hypothetical protein
MNNNQINEITQRWLTRWRNPETRAKMDAMLAALSAEDQLLLSRIGQRAQLNLPVVKMVPIQGSEKIGGVPANIVRDMARATQAQPMKGDRQKSRC